MKSSCHTDLDLSNLALVSFLKFIFIANNRADCAHQRTEYYRTFVLQMMNSVLEMMNYVPLIDDGFCISNYRTKELSLPPKSVIFQTLFPREESSFSIEESSLSIEESSFVHKYIYKYIYKYI